jgi:organic hydroperoxide reductase OsmC/OhrA
MPRDRLTRIALGPQTLVSGASQRPVTEARVLHLRRVAHRECYVSNSLKTPVAVELTVTICPSSDGPPTDLNRE